MISPRVIAHMKTELPNVLQYCTNKIEASHNMVVGKEELYIIIYIRLLMADMDSPMMLIHKIVSKGFTSQSNTESLRKL